MEFIDLKEQYNALREDIDQRIRTVLAHGQYILGPEVEELEQVLAAYTGARHCITVASGTEAILISLMAIGLQPGDEVITTPFSFISVAEMVALLGAVPVFADVEPDTCNIDPARIAEKVTARTRAIIPVSLYGQPADMDAINAIAQRHGLVVIEDAAQSFGATYRGARSCNLSAIGCTSFFPSKPLGCYGDGGAVFTSDDNLARLMREIRTHGQERRYVHSRIGVGGRMDTLQCAIVLAKLKHFDWEIQERIRLGSLYNALFEGKVAGVQQRPDCNSVFAQYTVMVEDRDGMQLFLKQQGIPTAVHYPVLIPEQPGYARFGPFGEFPVASRLTTRVMSLPMGPYLGADNVHRVVEKVLEHSRGKLAA
jgi:UDP-2-acetamido-2-deoxy-ribo-hexuluronate aminotransferase